MCIIADMPRRIPKSKKHKKIKFVDPDSRRKIERKPNAVNLPPNEDQEIPRKLRELIRLKNLVKENKIKKKRKKKKKGDYITVKSDKEKEQEGMTNPVKYIPDKMKQRENETEEHFIWRINQLANQSLVEAEIDRKYGVDVLEKNEIIKNDKKLKNKQL
ncbi:coiled-coil domain-containing protein 137-like isoform X1 [Centruroides sculpturatus]|uniref:coiled-coil domain-containing protein 137-like isoform X1 n=1 Tax=Centruroides sculpturatus TaxID=218467 RepID=UPI000C6CBD15|nr:coiled-coil domain-containing protein 137-like isoform X1 [Centruroides sculpturatus]